jgi:uncharacterized protein
LRSRLSPPDDARRLIVDIAVTRFVLTAAIAAFVLSVQSNPPSAIAAERASFDCRKAVTPTEYAICRSDALSMLDRDIAVLFRQRRAQAPSPQSVETSQRQWLAAVRDACNDDTACLDKEMSARKRDLQELIARFAKAPAPDKSGFTGLYVNKYGTAEIEAVSPTEFDISISTAEPTNARWMCDFYGTGRLKGTAIVVEHRPADAAAVVVTLTRNGGTLTVKEDRTDQPDYCGHNGTVEGTYRREKAKRPPRS